MNSSARLALGGLLAMTAAMGIGRFVYTPILPHMVEVLGWRASDAGLAASANFAGYLAGALAASRGIPAHLQRTGLLLALAASAATTAGTAASDSLLTISAMRFVGGMASAFVIVLSSTLVLARLAAAGAARLSAVHFAGVGTGIVTSAVVVTALSRAGVDWRGLWIASGAVSAAAACAVIVLIPPSPSASPAEMMASRTSRRGLPLFVAAYGLFGFGYVITATFIVTMVRSAPETRWIEGWIWIAFGLAAIPSVALWTAFGRRVGLATAFAFACLVEAVGVACSTEWVTSAGLLTSAVLLGGTFMGLTALGLMAVRELAGSGAQRAMALMTASFATGQMVGPVAAGTIADRLGSLRAPTLIAAAALLIAAALAWRSATVPSAG